MAASHPSRLLLRAGRSSVKSCIESGEMGEAELNADAQSTFDRLARDVEWPDRLANRVYLAVMVLPVTALYLTLRNRDRSEREAVDAVQAAFLASGESQRNFFKLILKSRVGRRLFLRSLRPNWLGLTPPPSNQWRLTERSKTRVTIEIARCYRWDAFNLVGTPEVASVACAFEEHMMSPSPYLRITGRSMATGADRCRYCFELLDKPRRQAVAG